MGGLVLNYELSLGLDCITSGIFCLASTLKYFIKSSGSLFSEESIGFLLFGKLFDQRLLRHRALKGFLWSFWQRLFRQFREPHGHFRGMLHRFKVCLAFWN